MAPSARHAHRDPALDGLRGIAVLLVFCFHFGGGLSSPSPLLHALGVATQSGWTGVVLFFALSGFLITGSFWDSRFTANAQPHALRNFYARRALRVLPLYAFLLIAVTIAALAHGASLHQLRPLGIFALFLQDLPVLGTRALNNPSPVPLYHLWSIAVEEQFYLLWPLILLLAVRRADSPRRGALRLTLSLFGCMLFYLAIVYGVPQVVPFRHQFDTFLFTHAGAILLGSALALRVRSRGVETHTQLHHWAYPALWMGTGLYLLASLLSGTFLLDPPAQFILGLPGLSLAATALIYIALHPGPLSTWLSWRPLRFTGRISYGVYVYQLVLQPFIHRLTLRLVPLGHGPLYFAVRFVLALALTLLTAWLSFRCLEGPFLRLKSRFPMHPALP